MQTRVSRRNDGPRNRGGFTLIELLVVIAIIAILASLLLPVLSRAKKKAMGSADLSNQKQLTLAWNMYAEDNSDRIVNFNIPNTPTTTAWMSMPNPGINAGMTIPQAIAAADLGWNQGLLAKYAPNPDIQHCPADVRFRKPIGPPGNVQWAYESYSGAGGANGGGFQDASVRDTCTLRKRADFRNPAEQYLFVEEQDTRNGYNEGGWGLNNPGCPITGTGHGGWWDTVAVLAHGDSSSLGWADGHAEMHRWLHINFTPAPDGYPASLDNPSQELDYMCIHHPFDWDAYRSKFGCP